MQEIHGDLFAHNDDGPDAICITTNGFVYGDQRAATMGRGSAGEAKNKWPGVQLILGRTIDHAGNHVHLLTTNQKTLAPGLAWKEHKLPYHLISFPTKHHWRDPSDIQLIDKSCQQVRRFADEMGFRSVVIPRPGCGLGQLSWDEVRPVCEKHLDDRFFIITFA